MAQQVAHRHVAADPRVGEAELRQVLLHRVVPRQLAFLHQQRHRRRGERLAARGDVGHRVLRHRLAGSAFADADRGQYCAVLHDRDREALCAELLAGALGEFFDAIGGERRRRLGQQGRGEQRDGERAEREERHAGRLHTRPGPARATRQPGKARQASPACCMRRCRRSSAVISLSRRPRNALPSLARIHCANSGETRRTCASMSRATLR